MQFGTDAVGRVGGSGAGPSVTFPVQFGTDIAERLGGGGAALSVTFSSGKSHLGLSTLIIMDST